MTATLDEAISAWPNRLLTLADWEAISEDETHRLEAAEGILAVTPRPLPHHQRAVRRLASQLETALPAEQWAVETECELLLSADPLTVRTPDVLVIEAAAFAANPARFSPDQVALAVEVVSPGSRRTDRVLKLAEYADAGIEQYWIVESAPAAGSPTTEAAVETVTGAVISTFALPAAGRDDTPRASQHGESTYQPLGAYTAPATVRVAGHPVSIDPAAFTSQADTGSP